MSVGLQPWLNEEDRQAALVEKHSRGEAARKIRAAAKAKTKQSHFRSKGWSLVKCVYLLYSFLTTASLFLDPNLVCFLKLQY